MHFANTISSVGSARELMALPPLSKLQSVFKMPEVFIRLVQVVKVLPADVLLIVKLLQRRQRSARAQPSFLSAVHPLEALHQELNIANASPVELYVDRLLRRKTGSRLSASLVNSLPGLRGLF